MRVAENKSKVDEKQKKSPPQTLKELQDLFAVVSEGKRVWETTFDAIVDPVLIVDQNYLIKRANLAAAASANVDVRDLVGKTCYQVFALRQSSCPQCPMGASHQKNDHRRKSLDVFSDGREFAASAFPIKGKEVQDLGLAVMQYQDMSALRKLESQVLQNEKMVAMGQFASGIAHDINNPLSGVLAFAQLALQQVEKGTQVYEDIKEIETSALRCKKIVEELLHFSKPLRQDDRVQVDLGKLIKKVLPPLEVLWDKSNYRLKLELTGLPPVFVSEAKFEQVFTNLLMNAYQAIASGGQITIRCGEEGSMVWVDIADDGEGIYKENLKRIFDPYFTTKEKKGGTGLGLPTTYNIVREHGGRIKVKSRLGSGASFRVFVPKGELNE